MSKNHLTPADSDNQEIAKILKAVREELPVRCRQTLSDQAVIVIAKELGFLFQCCSRHNIPTLQGIAFTNQ